MSQAATPDVLPGRPIQIHDPSLRDGHHAVRHNLGPGQLRAYAEAADAAGVPVVEVGAWLRSVVQGAVLVSPPPPLQ